MEGHDTTFNFTVSLPRRSSIVSNPEDQPQAEDGPGGDEEWSWETDGDCAASSDLSPKTRRLKMREDASTSSDSGCGPSKSNNSDSLNCNSSNSPGAGHSATSDLHSSHEAEHEENSASWNSNEDRKGSKAGQAEEHLFDYLEETFKVLNGAYQIITGSSYNSEEEGEVKAPIEETNNIDETRQDDKSFEEVVEGVSSQCAILETELRSSASPRRSASVDCQPQKLEEAKTASRSKSQQNRLLRPTSGQRSRPTSRQQLSIVS